MTAVLPLNPVSEPTLGASTLATNRALIADLIQSTQSARWEEFDAIYRGIVFGMARRAGLAHHDAEDVTQDVFRDLARSLCRFQLQDRRGSFRRYLFNLVDWRIRSKYKRHAGAEAHRAFVFDPESGADPLDQVPAPEAPAGHSEADFREALTRALLLLTRDLPARHVQVLDLYYCKEWSAKRVAHALKLPVATVFVIAHRNKLRLVREILRHL
jgi:RNA polymerase sigma factor (sigma-70 family)